MSDIPRPFRCQLSIFADDTALTSSSKKQSIIVKNLTRGLKKISKFFTDWKIKINPVKTEALFVLTSTISHPRRLVLSEFSTLLSIENPASTSLIRLFYINLFFVPFFPMAVQFGLTSPRHTGTSFKHFKINA